MANISVTLDVTGFYFSHTVTADESVLKTIKDVMLKVVEQTADTDHEFSFKSLYTSKGEFCSKILINHRKPPKSRQFVKEAGGFVRFPKDSDLAAGIYGFDDENVTHSNPQLAWQYYVVANNGRGALRSGEIDGRRTVVPFSDSNRATADGGVVLQDNDVITWRLVGICLGPTNSTGTGGGFVEGVTRAFGINNEPSLPVKYRRLMKQ